MKYVVITVDAFGRTTIAPTHDAVWFLADRVARGIVTAKQAAEASVFELARVEVASAELTARITELRYLVTLRDNPGVLREQVQKKQRTDEDVERIRDQMRTYFPLEADRWCAPWPWTREDDDAQLDR